MRRVVVALCLLSLGFAVSPVLAQGNHLKIFGGASYVAPLSEEDVTIASVRDSVEASDELGWTLGLEFRFTDHFGLELDYVNVTNDVDFAGSKLGEVDFSPLSATFDIHLVHTKVVDFYLGPTATYVQWGDVKIDPGASPVVSKLDTDNNLAWGASVGLDIGLGDHWAVTGGVRWINTDLELADSSTSIGVDPLMSRLGLALRF